MWLFSLGYGLCFGVILAKTWRVYYIFNNPKPKKKVSSIYIQCKHYVILFIGSQRLGAYANSIIYCCY